MFNRAYEKAKIVLDTMCIRKGEMVSTGELMRIVETVLGIDIRFALYDFSSFDASFSRKYSLTSCCAAISFCHGEARILLNKELSAEAQRFAMAHSLGRLIMEPEKLQEKDDNFEVSVYVEPDVSRFSTFSDDILKDKENSFLWKEQAANIFALLVLIPDDILWKKIVHQNSMESIAVFFGVEKTALESRLMLGCTSLLTKE